MQKQNKKSHSCLKHFSVLVIALMLVFFISAEEEKKTEDYGKIINANGIIGNGIRAEKTAEGYLKLTFAEKDATVMINGHKFENIMPYAEKYRTYNGGELVIDKNARIITANFITNEKGGKYKIDGTEFYAPPEYLVEFDRNVINKGVIISLEAKIGEVKEVPVSKDGSGIKISYRDGSLFNADSKFYGTITFNEKGEIVLEKSNTLVINRITIKNNLEGTGKELRLFFDNEEHGDNSVSFGDKKLIVNSKDLAIETRFGIGNTYLKIDDPDLAGINIGGDSKFIVETRDSEGLIPKVSTFGDRVRIIEDSKSLSVSSGNIIMDKLFFEYFGYRHNIKTTSPIELIMLKKDSSNFLGNFGDGTKISDYKVLVDNFNRFAIVPKDAQESSSLIDGISTKFSARIDYNYLEGKDIELLTGKKVEFVGVIKKGVQDVLLGKMRDYWTGVSDEIKSSINRVKIFNSESFKNIYGSNYAGVADPVTKTLELTDNNLFSFETFLHESAHTLGFLKTDEFASQDYVLNEKLKEFYSVGITIENLKKDKNKATDDKAYIGSLKVYYEEYDLLQEEIKSILSARMPSQIEWEKIAGAYDKIAQTKQNYEYKEFAKLSNEQKQELVRQFGSDYFNKPRYGYVRPYGGRSAAEDIATFVEKSNTPLFFKPLINPQSKEYNPIYRSKLDWLVKYGYIPVSRYKAILKEAGVE